MHPTLEDWVAEIFNEHNIEVWCISRDDTLPKSIQEWCEFLAAAFKARKSLYPEGISYAWHDAQAGQLRFNTGVFSRDRLPFGCKVILVDSPHSIVEEWLSDPGYIAWSELEDIECEDPDDKPPTNDLNVWAVEHRALA